MPGGKKGRKKKHDFFLGTAKKEGWDEVTHKEENGPVFAVKKSVWGMDGRGKRAGQRKEKNGG